MMVLVMVLVQVMINRYSVENQASKQPGSGNDYDDNQDDAYDDDDDDDDDFKDRIINVQVRSEVSRATI